MFAVLVFVAVCALAHGLPVGENSAMLYLSQYGYIPKTRFNSSTLIDESKFAKAVSDFQSFAGLNITGELDDETLKTMTLPRCGVQDKVGTGSDTRSKRYALQGDNNVLWRNGTGCAADYKTFRRCGPSRAFKPPAAIKVANFNNLSPTGSRWKVKSLFYRISKYPKNLKRADVDKELQRAFNVWSEYTDLNFSPSSTRVHIDIRFESGEHGDGDPFDGPGGTLAHAYFPVYGGDAHFDAAESWTINTYKGTNLFQVAAHEFGHSLGLSHSDVRSALMAPFYRGYEPYFNLDRDDIEGIQALYGKKSKKTPSAPAPPPNDDDDDGDTDESGLRPSHPAGGAVDKALCSEAKFDTIFKSAEGNTYVFKGGNYWQLTDDSVMPGYPKAISKGWPGLPSNIDAAFTYKNGKTYFFKGKQYWRYQGRKMDGQYPKDISDGFTGIPDDLDAATVWSGNGKIYFYKGSKFWRFDPMQRPPVKGAYPKPIANWEGLPNNIDAAFKDSNGYTYFFKDGAYYRFNDRAFAVDLTKPAFPRSTAFWWFGCKEAPRGTIGTYTSRGSLTSEESDAGLAGVDDAAFDAVDHHMPENGSHLSQASWALLAVAMAMAAVLLPFGTS